MDITETMRVTVRTEANVLASNLTLDEAVAFLESDTTPRRGVILPNGGYLDAGMFRGWVGSTKAAIARNAVRSAAV
jgi:hypothetical protein